MYSLLSFITTFTLIVGAQSYATLVEAPGDPATPTQVTSPIDLPPPVPSSTPSENEKEEYKPGWCNVLLEEPVRQMRGQCPFSFHEFPCNRTEPSTDPLAGTDVRHLRPEDIKIAMAIGDSMTAGFAIESRAMSLLFTEFRGKSFSAGADVQAYSIFNFLKKYNQKLLGGSAGKSLVFAKGRGLNQAVSGSISKNLSTQIDELVTALQSDTYDTVRDDWKMLTILIGPNDVCKEMCGPKQSLIATVANQIGQTTSGLYAKGKSFLASMDSAKSVEDSAVTDEEKKALEDSVKSMEEGVRAALENARLKMKRMHVNLVGNFKFSGLVTPQNESIYCRGIRGAVRFCSCDSSKEKIRRLMDEAVDRYNAIFARIAKEYENKYDDFNVVYQPAFVNLHLESYGLQLLSSFDCYHPNDCGGHAMAYGLWNNMWMEPEHKYTTVSTSNQIFMCPNGNMYLK